MNPRKQPIGASVQTRERMMRTVLAVLATLVAQAAAPAAAQSRGPFSTLELLAAGAADVQIGDLDDFWRPGRGWLIRLSTPFYLGTAAAGFQNASYAARSVEQPDFRLRTATVEWNVDVRSAAEVRGFAGVHAGATAMNFVERVQKTDNVDENEFVAGLQAGLSVPIGGGFGATVFAAHRKTYTRHPLRLSFLALGIHYSRATPERLRELLE